MAWNCLLQKKYRESHLTHTKTLVTCQSYDIGTATTTATQRVSFFHIRSNGCVAHVFSTIVTLQSCIPVYLPVKSSTQFIRYISPSQFPQDLRMDGIMPLVQSQERWRTRTTWFIGVRRLWYRESVPWWSSCYVFFKKKDDIVRATPRCTTEGLHCGCTRPCVTGSDLYCLVHILRAAHKEGTRSLTTIHSGAIFKYT